MVMQGAKPLAETGTANFDEQFIWFWISRCNEFLRWQMQEVIEKAPAPGILNRHAKNVRALLHTGRMLYADVADPESALNHLAAELSGKLLQLQESWDMIHNPMPPAEAGALLSKYFPDESGSGRAA